MFLVPKGCLFAEILAVQMTAIHAGGTSAHSTDDGVMICEMATDGSGCAVFDAAARFGKGRSGGQKGCKSQCGSR
ncbi:hypothetical protein AA100600_1005 [Gluconobacter thailandicus F149-1 = NBRC 100600]|nr:hypothetical protein AA100600_1005 [Gluconobacter thailandicus F149-1 = NBRC 100600]